MPKKQGMNKHQKAAHRVGERQIGREQICEMLELSRSADPADRLVAAENLCPCHVRTRIPEVWDALFQMMQDVDPHVRHAAWHTIEDGGKPTDEVGIRRLEQIFAAEQDPKMRRFAEATLRQIGIRPQERVRFQDHVASLRPPRTRGKCDFCGKTDAYVELDTQTMIPTGSLPRAARICDSCAAIVP